MKNNTPPLLAVSASMLLVIAPSAQADLIYAAPGMNKALSDKGTSISASVNLGHYWYYEITGCEWALGAGRPVDGSINQDGTLLSSNGSQYTGLSKLGCSANSQTVLSGAELIATNVNDVSGANFDFSTPTSFSKQAVVLTFTQDTNMTSDGASFISLRAIALKEPPVPTGDITVDGDIVRQGATPSLYWSINRRGADSPAPPIDPGTGPAADTYNSDANKTNNGHGNNEDGVDASNPGKSAQVWNDKFGIIDQSASDEDPTNDDDESTGGGAAPSGQ